MKDKPGLRIKSNGKRVEIYFKEDKIKIAQQAKHPYGLKRFQKDPVQLYSY